jgi:hypothetical protein
MGGVPRNSILQQQLEKSNITVTDSRELMGGLVVCKKYRIGDSEHRMWEASHSALVMMVFVFVLSVMLNASATRGLAKRYNKAYSKQGAYALSSRKGESMSATSFMMWSVEVFFNMLTGNIYGLYLDASVKVR